jgi:D-3-phosphoglycerate dehydrogenase
MKVLAADGVSARGIEILREAGFEVDVKDKISADELVATIGNYDALIVRSASKVTKDVLAAAKNLKIIGRAGVGVDNIAVKSAEANGIAVKNTPNSSSNAVAELAIAHLFSCARYISLAGHTMREHLWEKKAYSKGFELEGKTMGVIGYGRIGRLVGKKAQALGMNVLSVVHRNKPEGVECETMHFVTMDELLAKSDIITLCAPGAAEGPLVSAESIAKMKDGVVIINVSRGSNVDEAALLDALNSGKVKAAGLDVWLSEKEPNWALAEHPAVSCTPHVGAGTKEAQKKIGKELISVVKGFFE